MAWGRVIFAVPLLYQQLFYVPTVKTIENAVTPDKWMMRWQGPPRYTPIKVQTPPFVPAVKTIENTITPDKWLVRWQGPPRYVPPKLLAQPFVPKEAVLENTVTPDKWIYSFAKAVPGKRPIHTQPFFGYPYVSVAVADVTPDKWLVRFNKAVPKPRPVHTQPFFGFPYQQNFNVATVSVGVASRRSLFYQVSTQPVFVPPAVSNLTTSIEWLQSWRTAAPTQRPIHTQPFFGYPYTQVVPDLGTSTSGPGGVTKRILYYKIWSVLPPAVPAAAAAPQQVLASVTTGQASNRPLFYQALVRPITVPPAVSNLTTSIEWLVGWQGPVPAPQPIHTQPFGQPLNVVQQPNLTTSIEWLRGWQGPPRYWPPGKPARPFVAKEATLENTVTPDKWLKPLSEPVPHGWPPYAGVTFPAYPYQAADNTITPDKWTLRWRGPPRYWPPKLLAQPFVAAIKTIENTGTLSSWHRALGKAAPHGWPNWQIESLVYQKPEFVTGGPADEPERIACVPAASRTATVPELTRVAYAPEASRIVDSNNYGENPCHDT